MSYKLLFIFLEGNDDQRFFEGILMPLLLKKYSVIKFWQYSRQKQEKTADFVKSIKSMNADYIFARDLNSAPCITTKKEEMTGKFNHLTEDKIIVVVKEIESWYLAGLDDNASKKVRIRKKIRPENNITKEKFNQLIPKNMSRIGFMLKILENYEVEIARENNTSFEYFLNKWADDAPAYNTDLPR